jgi:ketosteroid isomerase-like protein
MSQANVESYREVLAAWNDGDFDRMLNFMADEVEVSSILTTVEGGYHGHDGVRRWWQNFHETFPDWHVEIQGISSVGDATIARLHARGHGGESGVPVDQLLWHVVHWRDGKAIRVSSHGNEADGLEAAGLSE